MRPNGAHAKLAHPAVGGPAARGAGGAVAHLPVIALAALLTLVCIGGYFTLSGPQPVAHHRRPHSVDGFARPKDANRRRASGGNVVRTTTQPAAVDGPPSLPLREFHRDDAVAPPSNDRVVRTLVDLSVRPCAAHTTLRHCDKGFFCEEAHEGDADEPQAAGHNGDTVTFVRHEPKVPSGTRPKGTLLLLHGCGHTSLDFCLRDAKPDSLCTKCQALPEEMRVVAAALDLGLLVIAVSSKSTCWNTYVPKARASKDFLNIAHVLFEQRVLSAVQLDDLRLRSSNHSQVRADAPDLSQSPLYVFGASSGGTFAALTPKVFAGRVRGVVVQISGRKPERAKKDATHVRVVYSTMSRDEMTTGTALHLAARSDKKTEMCPVVHHPHVISAEFFADHLLAAHEPAQRVGRWAGLAKAICGGSPTEGGGLCDAAGRLSHDPRHAPWRPAVAAWQLAMEGAKHIPGIPGVPTIAEDTLKADRSAISEVLNVAFAFHEFTSEHATAMLRYLMDDAVQCSNISTAHAATL